jgi:hypothetical protein
MSFSGLLYNGVVADVDRLLVQFQFAYEVSKPSIRDLNLELVNGLS